MSDPAAQRQLTSQEYIAQIRARREERRSAAAPLGQAISPAPISPVMTEPVVTMETPQSPPTSPSTPGASPMPTAAQTRSPALDQLADIPKPIAEVTLMDWQAPSRPFKKRNRKYFTTVITIVLLLSLILFFAGQILPIAVVISVAFLAYVLSTVPPEIVAHKITTYGIRVEDTLYFWEELGRFWFDTKHGQALIHLEVARFPGRITLLLGNLSQEELTEILSEVLLNEKPKPTFFDKAALWLQEKIPLEVDDDGITAAQNTPVAPLTPSNQSASNHTT